MVGGLVGSTVFRSGLGGFGETWSGGMKGVMVGGLVGVRVCLQRFGRA